MYNFGSHEIDLDLEYHKKQFADILKESKAKITGIKGHNLFYSVSKEDKKFLQNYSLHSIDWGTHRGSSDWTGTRRDRDHREWIADFRRLGEFRISSCV